jgi:hypothetical protein
MDYLRCNPRFNGCPRYDFVIANLSGGRTFAQLVFVFVCEVGGKGYPLALVQPLEKPTRPPNVKKVDRELSISRWRAQPRTQCEVIPSRNIERGAVLVKDPTYSGDHFLIDTLDEDMYLRVWDLV